MQLMVVLHNRVQEALPASKFARHDHSYMYLSITNQGKPPPSPP